MCGRIKIKYFKQRKGICRPMKKLLPSMRIFILTTVICFSLPLLANAAMEWTLIEQVDLDANPLDIATSLDGSQIFVLTRGEILVYSADEEKVTMRVPVDEAFDRLAHSIKDNTLVLSSSTAKTFAIIQLETVQQIDISGLPYKGPSNAPVTIAVFSDYQ